MIKYTTTIDIQISKLAKECKEGKWAMGSIKKLNSPNAFCINAFKQFPIINSPEQPLFCEICICPKPICNKEKDGIANIIAKSYRNIPIWQLPTIIKKLMRNALDCFIIDSD